MTAPGGDDRRLDFHPGMGMRWEITRSTLDTAGELFEATNRLDPHMPGPPVHAMLFGKYPREIRTTRPPNWVFKSLAFVGRALRFKL